MIITTSGNIFWSILSVVFAISARASSIPGGWKVCRVSEPDRAHCLKNAAQSAFKTLINGNKVLGLPSVDPLIIDKMVLTDRGTGRGPLSVRFELTNCTHTGAKSLIIESFTFDCENLTASAYATIKDDVTITGHYNVSGRVLLLNLTGSGQAKFIFKNQKLSVKMAMINITRSGAQYLKLKGLAMNTVNGQVITRLDNLFNGNNKLLGESIHEVVNENWKEFFEELSPSMNREVGRIISVFPRKIFRKIPLSSLCPQ